MPSHKFPPRGYNQMQYPLPHIFDYHFEFGLASSSNNSSMATILRTSKAATGSENVEVNPAHTSFNEDAGPMVFNGSIVPRMNIQMTAWIPMAAQNAAIPVKYLLFNWMPIYVAFKDSVTAEDTKTGVKIEDILELTKDTATNFDVTPLFTGTNNKTATSQPFSTVTDAEAFGDYNLTGDGILEAIAFDKALYYKAKRYYSNRGMLNRVAPRMNTAFVTHEKPWFFNSSNFTNPTVKRGNDYTFCGIIFHLPQANQDKEQLMDANDVTDIVHLQINARIQYDEWNPNFDQTAI